MANILNVVGVGPGDINLISAAALNFIQSSDVLIGGARNLQPFKHLNKEELLIGQSLDEVKKYIIDNNDRKKIVVMASGDPGIHSILGFLQRTLTDVEIEVTPGISSLQYFCSKLKIDWSKIPIRSLHGRSDTDIISTIRENDKTFVLTGGEASSSVVCKYFMEHGLININVIVGENLSYENERIVRGTPDEISKLRFDSLSVMLIENHEAVKVSESKWNYRTPGVPDSMFTRGEVPMTKEEIRALALCKLRLTGNETVVDIGAGTGSIAIECGLICRGGRVYAIEKEEDAIELIKTNAHKFGLDNIIVVPGTAPSILREIPVPDRVFIGGSNGGMECIIQWIKETSKFVRVVVNTVTVESTYEAITSLEKEGFQKVEVINVSVSKGCKLGGKHLMQAQNPVYIISAELN